MDNRMIQPRNIHSLTEFQRNAKEYLDVLRNSGEPHVLTVNGKAEVVVQNAEAYQKMLEEVDYWGNVRELRARIEDIRAGKTGRPMREALSQFAGEVGVDLD